MKKLLFIGMMCVMSVSAFANEKIEVNKTCNITSEISKGIFKGSITVDNVEVNETLQTCTVTITIDWVNEYGIHQTYTTGTATAEGPFACTIARMLAEGRAEAALEQ